MSLETQRRLAAQVMKKGITHVWIDPESIDKVKSAITHKEVRKLIHENHIRSRPGRGVSRARARLRKHKRRVKGHGSRKAAPGKSTAPWPVRIRTIRAYLRDQRDRRLIDAPAYAKLMGMGKGGGFRSLAHLKEYIETHGMLRRR